MKKGFLFGKDSNARIALAIRLYCARAISGTSSTLAIYWYIKSISFKALGVMMILYLTIFLIKIEFSKCVCGWYCLSCFVFSQTFGDSILQLIRSHGIYADFFGWIW